MVFFNKLFLIDDPNFWKLDKIDKIVIILILLVGCACACFAVETETVATSSVSGIYLVSGLDTFQELSSASVGYFPIEPGYIYHVTNTSGGSARALAVSDDIPVLGGSYTFLTNIYAGDTYDFQASQLGYAYFDYSWYPNVTVTREPLEGMEGSVDLLSVNVGANIWESFTNSLPFVLPLVLVCFGMYIIAHFVNKNSKGV